MGSIDWLKDNGQPITTNDKEETIKYVESIGWKRVDLTVDADKGSGIPGSFQWHKSAILGMNDKAEILDYLNELKLKVDMRGNLKKAKAKAISAIKNM